MIPLTSSLSSTRRPVMPRTCQGKAQCDPGKPLRTCRYIAASSSQASRSFTYSDTYFVSSVTAVEVSPREATCAGGDQHVGGALV
jgi:hypothetical protein